MLLRFAAGAVTPAVARSSKLHALHPLARLRRCCRFARRRLAAAATSVQNLNSGRVRALLWRRWRSCSRAMPSTCGNARAVLPDQVGGKTGWVSASYLTRGAVHERPAPSRRRPSRRSPPPAAQARSSASRRRCAPPGRAAFPPAYDDTTAGQPAGSRGYATAPLPPLEPTVTSSPGYATAPLRPTEPSASNDDNFASSDDSGVPRPQADIRAAPAAAPATSSPTTTALRPTANSYPADGNNSFASDDDTGYPADDGTRRPLPMPARRPIATASPFRRRAIATGSIRSGLARRLGPFTAIATMPASATSARRRKPASSTPIPPIAPASACATASSCRCRRAGPAAASLRNPHGFKVSVCSGVGHPTIAACSWPKRPGGLRRALHMRLVSVARPATAGV